MGCLVPTLMSLLIREQIRLCKPILKRFHLQSMRVWQDRLGQIKLKKLAPRLNFYSAETGGFGTAELISRKDLKQDDGRVILYLHGGGYVAGGLLYARGFAGALANATSCKVLCTAYRLAPEFPFPAAVEDAVASYRYLLAEGYQPEKITLVGESAGGGLCFCLCLALRQQGFPMPRGIVGISPWTDLTFSGESYFTNRKKDPSLWEDELRSYAQMYAGEDRKNPLVSPVFGEYQDFPPSLIFAGGDEILLDDARMLHQRIVSYGSRSELVVEKGMWHVYVLFGVRESDLAIERIKQFLERRDES